MTNNILQTKHYIYQIGDGDGDFYIPSKNELSANDSVTIRQEYEQTTFSDGQIRKNLANRNYIEDSTIEFSFLVRNEDAVSLDYVKKILNLKILKAFFVKYDSNSYPSVFFNPSVDVVSYKTQTVQPSEELGQTYQRVSATLKLAENPFLYECKPNIAYFDETASVVNKLLIGSFVIGDGSIIGQADIVSKVLLSGLTLSQLQSFFEDCNPKKQLIYIDKFFDKSEFNITTGQEVINQTLTSNAIVSTQTTTIYKNTTAENRTYLIEISGILNQNEWISIRNASNDSGIKITWKSTTPSPSVIYYNSFYNACFNSSGAKIETVLIDQPESFFLFFSPLKTFNTSFQNEYEIIQLNKVSTNNLTVKVENLNTYKI